METGEIIQQIERIATDLNNKGYTLLADKYLRKIPQLKNNSKINKVVYDEEARTLMVKIIEDLYKLAVNIEIQNQMLKKASDILENDLNENIDKITVELKSYKTDFQEIQNQILQFYQLMPNIKILVKEARDEGILKDEDSEILREVQ
ncbi:hypothetical protein AA0X95_20280 [Bacillus sp. 1P10SD]|uniref:hypothetical protein n=1 Tax=Bacillus sp. 1P10SD TaxID=3132265 RepID=UPI0039A6F75E